MIIILLFERERERESKIEILNNNIVNKFFFEKTKTKHFSISCIWCGCVSFGSSGSLSVSTKYEKKREAGIYRKLVSLIKR